MFPSLQHKDREITLHQLYPPHRGILPQWLLMSRCSKKSETQWSYFQIYHCHKLPKLPDCSRGAKLFPYPLLSPIASSIAIYSKHMSGKCLSNWNSTLSFQHCLSEFPYLPKGVLKNQHCLPMKSQSRECWIILQHCPEHLQKIQYKHDQNPK